MLGSPDEKWQMKKKWFQELSRSDAGQPFHLDVVAGVVAPELDELLDGEDTGQAPNAPVVLGAPTLGVGVDSRLPAPNSIKNLHNRFLNTVFAERE
jgi:hypothetical protein